MTDIVDDDVTDSDGCRVGGFRRGLCECGGRLGVSDRGYDGGLSW